MQLSFRNEELERGPRTLAELGPGDTATVVGIELPPDFANRLMELGFLPGSPVHAAFSAPGGDPRVFRVDGAEIALRRETALHILVDSGAASGVRSTLR
jgi:ferrous iron transport protein A